MEGRAHDVVVVAGENRDARAALPVPDADRLHSTAQKTKKYDTRYHKHKAWEHSKQRSALGNIRETGSRATQKAETVACRRDKSA